MLYLYFIKLRRTYRAEPNEVARYLVVAKDGDQAKTFAREDRLDPRDWIVEYHMYVSPAPQGLTEGTLTPLP